MFTATVTVNIIANRVSISARFRLHNVWLAGRQFSVGLAFRVNISSFAVGATRTLPSVVEVASTGNTFDGYFRGDTNPNAPFRVGGSPRLLEWLDRRTSHRAGEKLLWEATDDEPKKTSTGDPPTGTALATDNRQSTAAEPSTSATSAPPNVRRLPFVLFGSESAPRADAPEPSLLPHLARLIPAWSVQTLLDLAWDIGHGTSASATSAGDGYGMIGRLPAWISLWEATFAGLTTRYFDLSQHYMGPVNAISQLDVDIARAVYYRERVAVGALLDRLTYAETGYATIASQARLAPLLDDNMLTDFFDEVDPRELDAESTRSLLGAANDRLMTVPRPWVDRALEDTHFEPGFSRRMHLTPALPTSVRADVAVASAEALIALDAPDWYFALGVSRITPFLADSSILLKGRHTDKAWTPFLERLVLVERPTGIFGDVIRAHPRAADLLKYMPPQEGAAEAVNHMELVPSDQRSPQAGLNLRAAATKERKLHASVYVDGTEHSDTAFVAGARHLVAVSYTRQSVVPPHAAFGQEIASPDAESVTVTVRLVFNGLVAEAPLTLPADPLIDAPPATFAITPGAANAAIDARIIVYAQDGIEVIETATLSGDVVSTIEAARFHGAEIECTPTVRARRPLTAVASAVGASIVIDQHVAIVASRGNVLVADITSLHQRLNKLTAAIEVTAAEPPDPISGDPRPRPLQHVGRRTRPQWPRPPRGLQATPWQPWRCPDRAARPVEPDVRLSP